jgi:hypothetical protein
MLKKIRVFVYFTICRYCIKDHKQEICRLQQGYVTVKWNVPNNSLQECQRLEEKTRKTFFIHIN